MDAKLTLRRYADLDVVPWKNGLGETREIASGGPSGGEWRASLATLSRSAPFSAFPGKDRIFTNVGDAALTLSFDGEEKRIGPNRPFPFAGELTPTSRLDAPSSAFNMIFDEGTPEITVTADTRPDAGPGPWLLFLLEDGVLTTGEPVKRFDTVLADTWDSGDLFKEPTHALLVTLPE